MQVINILNCFIKHVTVLSKWIMCLWRLFREKIFIFLGRFLSVYPK